jgi:hypothetical protein
MTIRLFSNIHDAARQTLGQAAAAQQKPRSRTPHNRVEPHLAARCQAGDHGHCFSLHCVCNCHEVAR